MSEKTPTKIYLQLDGDGSDEFSADCATWCVDRIFDSDVVYVLESENAALNAKLEAVLDWTGADSLDALLAAIEREGVAEAKLKRLDKWAVENCDCDGDHVCLCVACQCAQAAGLKP